MAAKPAGKTPDHVEGDVNKTSDTLARIKPKAKKDQLNQIIKVAILAVGGQGGGVLSNWIVKLAENNGYAVQATSIAGVAQRTGSTVYYIEMLPETKKQPVFSLAPAESDVDIIIAAELMEAGRAIMRGFVKPGMSHMILSTHRQLATMEKIVPGNGTADADKIRDAIKQVCGPVTGFNMQTIADEEGTVISAALFGALAGSNALPFELESYRKTIRASGRGVERSLAAFERALTITKTGGGLMPEAFRPESVQQFPKGPTRLLDKFTELEQRLATLPEPTRLNIRAGLAKLAGYQDIAYSEEYLERIEAIAAEDKAASGERKDYAFTVNAAKYLANAMAYDDIIRVADLKTHPDRFARIAGEVRARPEHLIQITEYTHPGAAEIVSLMPARLGRWFSAREKWMARIDKLVNRGRHIRSDRIFGFLSFYVLAGLRRWRRSLFRHGEEMAHIEDWLQLARKRLKDDYDFGVETLRCRRLIKGYSDTHARGLSRFDRVMAGAVELAGRKDAAEWTHRLIEAALADHKDEKLDGALKTIRSFTKEKAKPAKKAAKRREKS